jgi:DNA mismatch endonuclease (patch repair protein)
MNEVLGTCDPKAEESARRPYDLGVNQVGRSGRVAGQRTVRVAAGVDLPYPTPTSAAATAVGKANRRSDTRPEVALRSELHRRGLRFRKDLLIRTPGHKVRVDICFTRARIAAFVDGCFWHVCPVHHQSPKQNTLYWGPKLLANVDRDRRNETALALDGWIVIRLWEHEPVAVAADRIQQALSASQ